MRRRANQQRANRQAVPGELGDDADIDAVRGLRAAEQILHEQRVLLAQRREEIRLQRGERLRSSSSVGLAPPPVDSVSASRTMNLSFADRPVCRRWRPPAAVGGQMASPRAMACSTSGAVPRPMELGGGGNARASSPLAGIDRSSLPPNSERSGFIRIRMHPQLSGRIEPVRASVKQRNGLPVQGFAERCWTMISDMPVR